MDEMKNRPEEGVSGPDTAFPEATRVFPPIAPEESAAQAESVPKRESADENTPESAPAPEGSADLDGENAETVAAPETAPAPETPPAPAEEAPADASQKEHVAPAQNTPETAPVPPEESIPAESGSETPAPEAAAPAKADLTAAPEADEKPAPAKAPAPAPDAEKAPTPAKRAEEPAADAPSKKAAPDARNKTAKADHKTKEEKALAAREKKSDDAPAQKGRARAQGEGKRLSPTPPERTPGGVGHIAYTGRAMQRRARAAQEAGEQDTAPVALLEEDEEETRPRASRRTYAALIAAITAVVLVLLAFFYFFMAGRYAGRFPKRTTINGVDVGGMTVDRAKSAVGAAIENYTLTIQERGGITETISAGEIDMVYEDDGAIDRLLDVYKPSMWLVNNLKQEDLTVELDSSFDTALAQAAIEDLDCFDADKVIAPQDATLAYADGQFAVQPETQGTTLREKPAQQAILAALEAGQTELDLDAEGLYQKPVTTADVSDLEEQAVRLNGYLQAEITFDFGDDRLEVVNADVIQGWVVKDENGVYDISDDLAFDYVKTQLAYKYDTFGLTHVVTAHNGDTVTLKGGDYGWCIARQDTTDKLVEAVKAGRVETMEPEYQYTAKNRGINDIGGTYIEISISEQMMWCYKDGECIVETPVVTGNPNRGNGTPYGSVWAIDGMKRNAVLGTIETMGYSSPVNYWIPFTGNVGIHDADGWRSSYGGDIYLTNGSHGCVNTPLAAVREIYNAVEIGTAVVVYDKTDNQAAQ